jgi:hypothetical protein
MMKEKRIKNIITNKPYYNILITLIINFKPEVYNLNNHWLTKEKIKECYDKYDFKYDDGNISRHLKILIEEDIVITENKEKIKYYNINPIKFAKLICDCSSYIYTQKINDSIKYKSDLWKYSPFTITNNMVKILNLMINYDNNGTKEQKREYAKTQRMVNKINKKISPTLKKKIQTLFIKNKNEYESLPNPYVEEKPLYLDLENNFLFNSNFRFKDIILIWIRFFINAKNKTFTIFSKKDIDLFIKTEILSKNEYILSIKEFNLPTMSYKEMEEVFSYSDCDKNHPSYIVYNTISSYFLEKDSYVSMCKKIIIFLDKRILINDMIQNNFKYKKTKSMFPDI